MKGQKDLLECGVALLAPRASVLGGDHCGGGEVVLWEDAAILERAGIERRVYGRAAHAGAPVRLLPLHTNAPVITSLEYGCQFLWKERHSLLLTYNEPTLAGLAPDRTIARFDWYAPLPRCWDMPGWLPRFQRARYLFPSESERQLFLDRHGKIPGSAACVLPNAVNLDLFKPVAHEPRHSLTVGFAGQWVPRKGIGVLLDAWHAVKSQVPAAELRLAGGANLWQVVQPPLQAAETAALVGEMERKGLLRCVGVLPRSQMPRFWSSVNIAVVPSLYEPFGLVALEALACGVPVIASRADGLKEIVVDGESGLLVPPGDSPALARALLALLTNEALRLRLAEGARRRAQAFSLKQRSRSLLEFLSERPAMAA